MLADDPAAETNNLLQLLVQRVDNSTLTPADLQPPPFTPSHTGLRINQLFSMSLTLSLLASFGALLAQQWIIQYKRQTPGVSDGGRWDRERKYQGAQRWRLRAIVEIILPLVLQAAVFVFIIGFMIFLLGLSKVVAFPNILTAAIGASVFILLSLCSLWDPFCPFQTPFTDISLLTIRSLGICIPKACMVVQWLCVAIVKLPLSLCQWQPVETSLRNGITAIGAEWRQIAWSWEINTSEALKRFQRQVDSSEALQSQAVHRFLEASGHIRLLTSTITNLPFPFNEVQDIDSLEVVADHRLRRLGSLFRLATRRNSMEERSAYAKARMHLALTEDKISFELASSSLSEEVLTCAVQAHLDTPLDQISGTISSISTVIASYLAYCSIDSTQDAREHVDFIRRSVSRAQQPLMVSRILSVMIILRASWSDLSAEDKTAIETEGSYESLRKVHENMGKFHRPTGIAYDILDYLGEVVDRNPDLVSHHHLTRLALSLYDPEDVMLHEITLSLFASLTAAIDIMDWKSLATALPVTEGLRNLFVVQTIQSTDAEEGNSRRNEAVAAAVDLVASFFVDVKRWYVPLSLRVTVTAEFVDALTKSLPLLTIYAGALGMSLDRGHPHSVGLLLSRLAFHVYTKDVLRNTPGGTDFLKALTLLPREVLPLHWEVRDWVSGLPAAAGQGTDVEHDASSNKDSSVDK